MNNRFKFRFWNKLRKSFENTYDLKSCEHLDYVVPEQCTGLKDKNGKLIYEGDICRIKGTYYDCDYKEYFEVDDNEKVESLEKFFGETMLKGVYSALGCDTLQVEVIGNIHENADLLENEE